MNTSWIKNLSLGALAAVAWLGGNNLANAQSFDHGHHHSCSPYSGYTNYSYRPITTLPYYGSNYGVGGYNGYSSNYGGYSSNYGGYSSNYGGLNQFGGYGMGGFPTGASYGGGAFPRGGSYGGGSFPRGGSYGGGGFSLYIGR
jgi:hypothetical protein